MITLNLELGLVWFAISGLYLCLYKWGISVRLLGFARAGSVDCWTTLGFRIGKFFETNDYGVDVELFGFRWSKHFKRSK